MELYMKLRWSEADYLLSKHHTIYNPHQQLLRLPGAQTVPVPHLSPLVTEGGVGFGFTTHVARVTHTDQCNLVRYNLISGPVFLPKYAQLCLD